MARKSSLSSQPTIITLSLLLYRWLLRRGPTAFHRDYAEPALQDFRQCCRVAYQQHGTLGVLGLWPALFGETLWGLLAEYWTELFGGKRPMLTTMRRSLVAAFWAFVLFLFAYTALMRILDPLAPFAAVGRLHPELAITYTLFSHSGEIALLAVLLGGLPVLFIAVRQAYTSQPSSLLRLFLLRPRQALLLLGAALLISVGFVAFILATQFISGAPFTSCNPTGSCLQTPSPALFVLSLIALIGGIALGIFVVLLIGTSLSLAVLRSEFGWAVQRFTLVPIGMLGLTMIIATVATITWTIRLWIVAPEFAASSAGLGNGQTAWVISIIVAMTMATGITVASFFTTLRGSIRPLSSSNTSFPAP